MRVFILSLLLCGLSYQAFAGKEGGGGDPNESTVYDIRQSILDWINNGDASSLIFKDPSVMNYDLYVSLMKPILVAPPDQNAVVVTFVTTDQEEHTSDPELKVNVDGQNKTCRGFISSRDNRPHILCNSDRFPKDPAKQFRQTHHEFAGLVRVEKNLGAASDYEFSNQLADFGQIVPTYKLGPRKARQSNRAPLNCLEGNEPQFLNKWFAVVTERIIQVSNKNGLMVEPSSIQLGIASIYNTANISYGYALVGSLQTRSGAALSIYIGEGSDFERHDSVVFNAIYFYPTYLKRSFDRLGNAIESHCRMQMSKGERRLTKVVIANSQTGKVLGTFSASDVDIN